ncbi:hypothetical protein BDF19DRAFT_412750 [Syncephalis fuscata]|nr:hypothetical protein BDF19DRAFT_412750 [Syncephalis fuscata]
MSSSSSSTPRVTILRIKRKRNEDPYITLFISTANIHESLVADVNTQNNDHGKKRLVDKGLTSPRMFRLAKSVPVPEEAQVKRVTREITSQLLSEHLRQKQLKQQQERNMPPVVACVSTPPIKQPSPSKIKVLNDSAEELRMDGGLQQPRFKVMPKNIARTISSSLPGSREGSPGFQLYDAIREQADANATPPGPPQEPESVRREQLRRALVSTEEEVPDEMNNFISLLRDHLTISDTSTTEENEFVYDFYYDDAQPIQRVPTHTATLIWLDDVDKEAFGENGFDSDNLGDSSESDDSNAEDYYANDYPDEDEGESDYINESDGADDSDDYNEDGYY